jgi:hypothetical protein
MVSSSESDELLRTYRRLRNLLTDMNKDFIRRLPKNSLMECAKKLGLTKGKVMVFNSPDETSILFDYCLFNSRTGGKTVFERYVEQTPPPPQSDEMTVLRAIRDSYFSVFQIRQVYRGRGVLLHDFFKKDDVLLMDIGLGDTGHVDMAMAGRILPFDGFHMSTGALLPLWEEPVVEAVAPVMDNWLLHHPDMGRTRLSPALEANFSAQLIRAALRGGALESANYLDVKE